MKALRPLALLFALVLSAAAQTKTQQLALPEKTPEGLQKSDWASIRAAHTAWVHGFMPIEGGWQARNPGQQWTTKFDARGFLTTPRDGGWTWGLELKSFGAGTRQTPVTGEPRMHAEGQRLTYEWDSVLQEWWVNDQRGLEHGYTVSRRPGGKASAAGVALTAEKTAASAPLSLLMATRGTLAPKVSDDALGVIFQDAAGATVINYTGLKVTDADGRELVSRFEAAGEKTVRLVVEDAAARYPITIDPIAQQAYVKPQDPLGYAGAGDRFGWSVAVSGDTVVVGAPAESSSTTGINSTPNEGAPGAGAAYVFVRSGTTWSQQAYLKPATVGTTQGSDGFGNSVAISGDTVVVGAPFEDSSTTGINYALDESAMDAGAAYVFVRSGTTWSQQAFLKPDAIGTTQAGDQFGKSVSVSGDTIVVGAPKEDSSTTGTASMPNEGATDAGAAYVFVRSGTAWSQQAYLRPSTVGTTQAGDNFGNAVAVSGDTVVVGAPFEDSSTTGINKTPDEASFSAGAAYVFVRSGTIWSQQVYLKPSMVGTTQADDQFGTSVALAGETVVIGAPGESSSTTGINSSPDEASINAGAAYVFVRGGTIWSQQAYLKAAAVGTTQTNDKFGTSVALSGDTVVVGAPFEDSSTTGINSTPNENASGAGAAYVFVRSGTIWSQQAYVKPAAFGTTQAFDRLGQSVAVSGDTVVIGAVQEDSSTTDINGTPNEGGPDAGAAYVFVRNGTTWAQQAFVKPAAESLGYAASNDQFGVSIAISGDTVVVGASWEDSSTTRINSTPDEGAPASGAAYVFVRNGATWSQQAYLKPAAVGTFQELDCFGTSVAISGDTIVVGAPGEDGSSTTGNGNMPNESASDAGAAYVFVRNGTTWSQQAYLKAATVGTTQIGDQFGNSVAASGDIIVVGAHRESSSTTGINSTPDEAAEYAGAAYIFVRTGTTWSQQAYLKPAAVGTTQAFDGFGKAVAVSGDTVVVGAPFEGSSTTGINSIPNESAGGAGASYVFVRSGTTWSQQAYLKPAAVGTTQVGDVFGTSVAVSGDTVVVGARGEDSSTTGINSTPDEASSDAGAAYVFARSGTTWSQQAYLKPASVGTTQAGDQFGTSVAVSGDIVVVGAPFEDSSATGINSTPDESASAAGAVYTFVRTGTTWSQHASLKPSAVGTTQADDQFGYSVAVSDGTVVVGAFGEDSSTKGINSMLDEGAKNAGAFYVFNQLALTRIAPTNGPIEGGTTVTISGADLTNTTAVMFGEAPATNVSVINPTTLTATTPAHAAGAVSVFVTTPTGTAELADGFRYVSSSESTLSGITVDAGPLQPAFSPADSSYGVEVSEATTSIVVTATTSDSRASASVNGSAFSQGGAVVSVPLSVGANLFSIIVQAVDGSQRSYSISATRQRAPVVTGVSPVKGNVAGGLTVTITGTDLSDASSITFGGVPATNVKVIDNGTITATTPAHASGSVDVAVTTTGGTGALPAGFYFGSSSETALGNLSIPGATLNPPFSYNARISSGIYTGWMNPNARGDMDVSVVTRDYRASVSINRSKPKYGETMAKVPLKPGVNGIIVDVTADDGTMGRHSIYLNFDPLPTVTSVSPASGSTAGGQTVAISGIYLSQNPSVTFGGVAATNVNVIDENTITATAPAHAAGAVGVEVNVKGGKHTLTNCYTYVMPTLTALSIASNNAIPSRAKAGDVITLSFSASETIQSVAATLAGHAAAVSNVSANNWTATATVAAGDAQGVAAFSVSYKDLAGHTVGSTTDSSSVIIDTIAPNPPIAPALLAASDSGALGDGITRHTTPTFTGTAETGAMVTLFDTDGTTVLGTGAASNGTFTIASPALTEGAHSITAKATDITGNTSAASPVASVVIDTTPPTLNPPANQTAEATSANGANVSYSPATATDALSGPPNITYSQQSGARFPLGTTTVTATATDKAGNSSMETFTVMIRDTTQPTITGPFASLVIAEGALPDYGGKVTVADNVGVVGALTQQPPPGTMVTRGTTHVTLRAKDAAMNEATKDFDVIVRPSDPQTAKTLTAGGITADLAPGAGAFPGLPADARLESFSLPATSDAGDLAFVAKWVGTIGGRPAKGTGLFLNDSCLALVGGDASAIAANAKWASFSDPVVDGGKLACIAKLSTGTTAVVSNFTGSALEKIALTGEAAEGAGDAKFRKFSAVALRGGAIGLLAQLTGGSDLDRITPANDTGIWGRDAGATLQLLFREGSNLDGAHVLGSFVSFMPGDGSPGCGRGWFSKDIAQPNTSTLALSLSIFTDKSYGLGFGSYDGYKFIARSGETGTRFAPAFNGASFESFHLPAMNDALEVVFLATMTPGDAVANTETGGIFFTTCDSNGSLLPAELIAQINHGAPDTGAIFTEFKDPVLAQNGGLAFPATIKGAASKGVRAKTLWWRPAGGSLKLLAQGGGLNGEPTDLPAGSQWAGFTSLAISNHGPIFIGSLVPKTGDATAANANGVWAMDFTGKLRTLVRAGITQVDVGTPGAPVLKTVKSFTLLKATVGSTGVTRSFNDAAQVVWLATFTDKTTAIVTTEVP